MWVEFKTVNNLITAEMWKEFFEAEGIPIRILPEGSVSGKRRNTGYWYQSLKNI